MAVAVGFEAYGEKQARDIEICDRVNRVLQRHYENHPFFVGCDHEAGYVVIRLAYPEISNLPWGAMIYVSRATDPDFDRIVMRAGGELLERWKLARGAANDESSRRAAENRLDFTGAIWKSKH